MLALCFVRALLEGMMLNPSQLKEGCDHHQRNRRQCAEYAASALASSTRACAVFEVTIVLHRSLFAVPCPVTRLLHLAAAAALHHPGFEGVALGLKGSIAGAGGEHVLALGHQLAVRGGDGWHGATLLPLLHLATLLGASLLARTCVTGRAGFGGWWVAVFARWCGVVAVRDGCGSIRAAHRALGAACRDTLRAARVGLGFDEFVCGALARGNRCADAHGDGHGDGGAGAVCVHGVVVVGDPVGKALDVAHGAVGFVARDGCAEGLGCVDGDCGLALLGGQLGAGGVQVRVERHGCSGHHGLVFR